MTETSISTTLASDTVARATRKLHFPRSTSRQMRRKGKWLRSVVCGRCSRVQSWNSALAKGERTHGATARLRDGTTVSSTRSRKGRLLSLVRWARGRRGRGGTRDVGDPRVVGRNLHLGKARKQRFLLQTKYLELLLDRLLLEHQVTRVFHLRDKPLLELLLLNLLLLLLVLNLLLLLRILLSLHLGDGEGCRVAVQVLHRCHLIELLLVLLLEHQDLLLLSSLKLLMLELLLLLSMGRTRLGERKTRCSLDEACSSTSNHRTTRRVHSARHHIKVRGGGSDEPLVDHVRNCAQLTRLKAASVGIEIVTEYRGRGIESSGWDDNGRRRGGSTDVRGAAGPSSLAISPIS